MQKQKTKKQKAPTPRDLLKLEIAQELGLSEKLEQVGWSGLTASETGRIGGLLAVRERRGG